MNRGEHLNELVKSEGWKEAKEMLTEKIMDIQSVMNIEGKTGEEVIADIKLRQNLVLEMKAWIVDIEGTALQHTANDSVIVVDEEDHIDRD